MQKKKKGLFKKIFISVVGLLVLLSVVGFSFEAIAGYYGAKKYPPEGKLVDVGGFNLHLQRYGEGGPTILFEAGSGESSNIWLDIPEELSQYGTVVTYDRAGYGWSDKADTERTGENIVNELYTALKKENIEGPYILVGHSLGGMYMRLFAQTYKDEVAGIVLLDSRHEDYSNETNQLLIDAGIDPMTMGNPSKNTLSLMKQSGVIRLMKDSLLKDIPEEHRDLFLNIEFRPKFFHAQEDELRNMGMVEDLIRNQSLGDIPLVIVTHGIAIDGTAIGLSEKDSNKMEETWQQQQKQTLELSEDSELIIAKNSGHAIMHDEPELVVDVIVDVVNKVK
ncbi:alpha/beta hydrolase [Ureibacillus xyleni]|nr:alpha/beta hydrolase [Ureibacillus xyleni]